MGPLPFPLYTTNFLQTLEDNITYLYFIIIYDDLRLFNYFITIIMLLLVLMLIVHFLKSNTNTNNNVRYGGGAQQDEVLRGDGAGALLLPHARRLRVHRRLAEGQPRPLHQPLVQPQRQNAQVVRASPLSLALAMSACECGRVRC